MNNRILCLLSLNLAFLLFHSSSAHAQCGMGVPSAGNPNCVPPGMPGSPYVTTPQNNSRQSVYQQPVIIKHEWANRWGAIIADDVKPVFGVSTGENSQSEAVRIASLDCFSKGGSTCNDVFVYRNQCAVFFGVRGGGGITRELRLFS